MLFLCKERVILVFSANRRIEAAKALMPERMVRTIMSKGIRLGEILKPTGENEVFSNLKF